MPSTVNWTIRAATVAGQAGYEVYASHGLVATIKTSGDRTSADHSWKVEFEGRPELDYGWVSREACIGYVRGIERVSVNEAHGFKFERIAT